LRTCPKCNKSNRPERKYCIRCGASLIKPIKEKPAPAPSEPVTADAASKTASKPTPPPEPTTEEEWVKPSEVNRDRVRSASSGKRKTEMEKAQEAFAKAETVGIDEEGSGVIETRMLRASEVKELLEGPDVSAAATTGVPAPTMMEGSEPLPEGAEELMMPSVPKGADVEQQILGSKSIFVAAETTDDEMASDTPEGAEEFASLRYETIESADAAPASESDTAVATKSEEKAAPLPSEETMTTVMECPNCGKIISQDQFSYPNEVYSAMGAARLKQARFLVVQGKNDLAMKELRIARSLFTRAGDSTGLDETSKLVDSLART
jgi:hypothetical protein